MKKSFLNYRKLLFIAVILIGCYPKGPEYADELDLVYTNYDKTYNFQAGNTYALPDKIVKITGKLLEGETPSYIKEPFNTQILAQIEKNMTSLGWTKVGIDQTPDILLTPAAWENTTITVWYDWWYYYGWWWGGYYPGWGGWYPGYPVVTSYSTGTLMMNITDPNNQSPDDRSPIVWTGIINGLFTGTYNTTRVNNAIDQAFTQSPYLNTK
jgi:hypothetical protein